MRIYTKHKISSNQMIDHWFPFEKFFERIEPFEIDLDAYVWVKAHDTALIISRNTVRSYSNTFTQSNLLHPGHFHHSAVMTVFGEQWGRVRWEKADEIRLVKKWMRWKFIIVKRRQSR